MASLLDSLSSSSSHFIRCIKSNSSCTASSFETDFVKKQLQAAGVVETISILQKGYPDRYVKFSLHFNTGPLYSSDLRIIVQYRRPSASYNITVLYTLINKELDNYTYEYIV